MIETCWGYRLSSLPRLKFLCSLSPPTPIPFHQVMLSPWTPDTLWGSALDLCEFLRMLEPHQWGALPGRNGATGQAGLLWMTGMEEVATVLGPCFGVISSFFGLEEKFQRGGQIGVNKLSPSRAWQQRQSVVYAGRLGNEPRLAFLVAFL